MLRQRATRRTADSELSTANRLRIQTCAMPQYTPRWRCASCSGSERLRAPRALEAAAVEAAAASVEHAFEPAVEVFFVSVLRVLRVHRLLAVLPGGALDDVLDAHLSELRDRFEAPRHVLIGVE